MSTYRIYFTQTASVTTEVEAESFEDAVDAAWDKIPGDICAQCSGWGRDYSMELGGDWDPDESGYEVDGEYVEVPRHPTPEPARDQASGTTEGEPDA